MQYNQYGQYDGKYGKLYDEEEEDDENNDELKEE
jgi:hypothetical protein